MRNDDGLEVDYQMIKDWRCGREREMCECAAPLDWILMNQKSDICLTRMLWVVPQDLFRIGSAETLSEELRESFDCDVWLLLEKTALAFSPRGLLNNGGMAMDYAYELQITRPLFRFIEKHLVPDNDCTELQIPDKKFSIRMMLQPVNMMRAVADLSNPSSLIGSLLRSLRMQVTT